MKFLSALALLLIGLKLAHVIDWSWWLILLPIYGGVAAFGIGILAAIILAMTLKKDMKGY